MAGNLNNQVVEQSFDESYWKFSWNEINPPLKSYKENNADMELAMIILDFKNSDAYATVKLLGDTGYTLSEWFIFPLKLRFCEKVTKFLRNHHLRFDCVYCIIQPKNRTSENTSSVHWVLIWRGRFTSCFSKLFRLLVRKNCSSDREKHLKNH